MPREHFIQLRLLYVLLLAFAVLLGCMVRATPGRWVPGNPYAVANVGYDVSWPNCDIKPPHSASWGIVGVTGGLSLRPQACARSEAAWFKRVSLYVNTGFPGSMRALKFANWPRDCSINDISCLAYNYGYAEGRFALAQATGHGLHAALWWLDVETSNSWDDNPLANRASIQGTYDAIRRETVVATVGVYSYPAQWDRITSRWRPGWPAWAATGSTTPNAALAACRAKSFTGGPIWLGQYTSGLDRDVPCL